MKFIQTLLISVLINIPAVAGICILFKFDMTWIDVVIIAAICSLIGVGLAYAFRYFIKLAKEHEA